MDLYLWTEDDLRAHFTDDSESLRETYFGDLVLSAAKIRDFRDRSIAPVLGRWIPEAHVSVNAEQTIRRALGELDYWPEVPVQAATLVAVTNKLPKLTKSIDEHLQHQVNDLQSDLQVLCDKLDVVSKSYTVGKLPKAIQAIEQAWEPRVSLGIARRLARELRRQRSVASLDVHIALASHRDAVQLLEELRSLLSANLIAVVGPAGSGKTHLAAELSAGRNTSINGLYLEGSRLGGRGAVQDLLRSLIDRPVEEVLQGIESAGVRAGVRIPVIIDGLNESEDPSLWASELTSLKVMLRQFRHVVVIVTTRPKVVDDALLGDCTVLELDGFGELTPEAVKKYFDHYRIDARNVRFPISMFQNPLLLKMFCEATNPDRELSVVPAVVPTSLLSIFSRFRSTAVKRIATQPGRMQRFDQDILAAIDNFALWLWNCKSRSASLADFRRLISSEGPDWSDSLARALRDEGIVSFDDSNDDNQRVVFLYDGLAGFIIGDALIRTLGKTDFIQWLESSVTLSSLGQPPGHLEQQIHRFTELATKWLPAKLRKRTWRFVRFDPDLLKPHPLASDIRSALAGLTPRRYRMQFWQNLRGELRDEAIVNAASLERNLLDENTINEIARIAMSQLSRNRLELFNRFHEMHDFVHHPLNADFIDSILRPQSVADRDLRWSEWIRHAQHLIVPGLQARSMDWKSRSRRTEQDRLQAVWIQWLLTSTIRDLRDMATYALYCYGRNGATSLFDLTRGSLRVNDPSLPERVLAATYGVLMAAPGDSQDLTEDLSSLLDDLFIALTTEAAVCPTYHWRIREYTVGIVDLACRYYPASVGQWAATKQFKEGSWPQVIDRGDPRNRDSELIYGFHFANYTIGGIIPNRGAYDFDNPQYQEVLSWIRGRVWDLGWRHSRFAKIDRYIMDDGRDFQTRPGRIEAYLKKYCWIGFFESAGRLHDMNRSPLDEDEFRLADVAIDPSFPVVSQSEGSDFPPWLTADQYEPHIWVANGLVEVGDQYFRQGSLESHEGPWVVLSGFLAQEDIKSRRKVFGFLHAILTRSENVKKLKNALIEREYPGNHWIPSAPSDYYLFAGEIPWHSHARRNLAKEDLAELYAGTIALGNSDEIAVEIPVHDYNWESYHSKLNIAGGHSVPATTLAQEFDLRSIPGSLGWCDPHGRVASMTMEAPPGFTRGDLLYFREDLLLKYCEKRNYELIWIAWGEREAWFADVATPKPEWVTEAYSNHANIWRRVISHNELRLDPEIEV